MKEKFARWDMLFIHNLKRDWKKIIVWIVGLGLFAGGFVPAFQEIAKGEGMIGLFETLQNPAVVSIVGPTPVETDAGYTIGAMYAQEMLLFSSVFAIIVSILHVVGHTRREEDLGLTELVRSFQVGRQANSLATMVETIVIHVLLTLFISGAMISFGAHTITVEGSFLFGATIGVAGITGAAIALVMAQIMPTSAAATGSSIGLIGFLYIIRAGTDLSNVDLSMINPLGWTYLTFPFTENNWTPLIFAIILIVFLLIVAFALEGARDMGAGYLPQREGRATAKQSLLSVQGLFTRINRGMIIAWLVAFVVMGIVYGSIYGDIQMFLEGNELIKQMFSHSGFSIEKSFTAMMMMVMISLVAILPIAIVNKLYTMESRLYLSQIYATKVSRYQLFWTNVGLAIMASIVGVLFVVGGLGAAALTVMGDEAPLNMLDFLVSGYNLFPTLLFFTGLAALAIGWIPKLGKIVYVYLAYAFFINYFGDLLELPDWILKTTIQNWFPQMPMENFSGPTFMTVTVISIVLMVIGYLGYRRRDMIEGS